jgi:chaperonin GroES
MASELLPPAPAQQIQPGLAGPQPGPLPQNPQLPPTVEKREAKKKKVEKVPEPEDLPAPIAKSLNDFENLAEGMDEERLKKISAEAIKGYENDLGSISEWLTEYKEWLKLFGLQTNDKSFPWPNASNVALPMITTAAVQFQARAFEAILPPKNIVKGVPLGIERDDTEKAERTARYMNYQLKFKMTEFESSFDTTLMQLPIVGSVFRKTYYDSVEQRVVSDYVAAEDFVINYNTRYIEKSPRYTQKLRPTLNEIKIMGEQNLYINTDKINTPGEAEALPEPTQQRDENNGVEQPIADEATPRLVLEQYTWLKIDEEKDTIKSPVVITIDHESQLILRITKRKNPKTNRVMEFFTAYNFIPNPAGSIYGIGFGAMLRRMNETINTLVNQLTDAGTLANTSGGFVNRSAGMRRGNISFGMGEYKEIDLRTDDIRKAIFPMQFKEPSNVLFSLLGLLQDYANKVTTVSEVTTGEMPKSDTAATAIVAVIEQGMKVFSAIHKRIHRSFQKELSKIQELNSLFLDESEYVEIVTNKEFAKTFGFTPEEVKELGKQFVDGRDDFSSRLDVQPVSDPNIASRAEKVAKAEAVYNTTLANPVTSADPEAVLFAYTKFLESLDVNPNDVAEITKTSKANVERQKILQQQQIILQQQQIDAANTGAPGAPGPQPPQGPLPTPAQS